MSTGTVLNINMSIDIYSKLLLKGLGDLAIKFPAIASSSIQYLKEFLINPSPILLRLYDREAAKATSNA